MKKHHTLNTVLLALLFISLGCEDNATPEPTPSTPAGEYTVTFEPNGGTLTSSAATVEITAGEKLKKPQDPTKVGSTLVAWQKPDGSSFKFDTETVTANTTLTARWELVFSPLTDLDVPSSALHWWMQRATETAQFPDTSRYFGRGTNTVEGIAVHIDGATTTTPIFTVTIAGPMTSGQTGITPTPVGLNVTDNPLDFPDLFGLGNTADQYAVNGDTLYIAKSGIILATMIIDSVQKGLFVKAGQAPPGLLLFSSIIRYPVLFPDSWTIRAQISDEAVYTGVSSVIDNRTNNLGVGSTLLFYMNDNGTQMDSLKFAQSPISGNAISAINDGIIVDLGGPSSVSHFQWPNLPVGANVHLHGRLNDERLEFAHSITFLSRVSVGYIKIIIPGVRFEVTYLPTRNDANPAEEITVTYERLSSN